MIFAGSISGCFLFFCSKKAPLAGSFGSHLAGRFASAMARSEAIGFFRRQVMGRKNGGALMKNQNASAELYHDAFPLCRAPCRAHRGGGRTASHGCCSSRWHGHPSGSGSVGGVPFFQITESFCGKAAGFPRPPFCTAYRAAAQRPAQPGLGAFAQRSSYPIFNFLNRINRRTHPHR